MNPVTSPLRTSRGDLGVVRLKGLHPLGPCLLSLGVRRSGRESRL